jgi:hypothetical protein
MGKYRWGTDCEEKKGHGEGKVKSNERNGEEAKEYP